MFRLAMGADTLLYHRRMTFQVTKMPFWVLNGGTIFSTTDKE